MPWITSVDPKLFLTSCKVTVAILFLTVHEAANKQPLHAHHNDDRRDHRKDRSCHNDGPICHVVARGEHLFDAHDDGVHFGIGGDQKRPEVLVPAIDEQDHKQGRDVGAAHGHNDIPEKPHRRCTVHPRGFGQLVRDGQKELAEQERCRRRGNQRKDQAGP